MNRLFWHDLKVMAYADALLAQEKFFRLCLTQAFDGIFLKVEHPAVITLGKNRGIENLQQPQNFYAQANIPIVKTDRGGDITAHMPGQLVVYPIFNFSLRRWTPKKFVTLLENIVIELCAEYQLKAHQHEQYPGVWLGNDKICALGIRVHQRVSTHGLALNVCNDLRIFDTIVPCGIKDKRVTSLSAAAGRLITIDEVWQKFLAISAAHLGHISPYTTRPLNHTLSSIDDIPMIEE